MYITSDYTSGYFVYLLLLLFFVCDHRPTLDDIDPHMLEKIQLLLKMVEVGSFVAVSLSNCDKVLALGKVLEATADRVKAH